MDVKINDYERVDDLHRNGYLIIQDPKRFCFGIDAVILSDFAEVNRSKRLSRFQASVASILSCNSA